MRCTSLYAFILICFLQFTPAILAAQISDPISTASLSGLTGLALSVGEIGPELQAAGLNAEQLQAIGEQKLRAAGIRIIPPSSWTDSTGWAQLYIEVSALKNGGAQYSYCLRLSVIQKAILPGKELHTTLAETWSTSVIGVSGTGTIAGTIRNGAAEEIDAFIGRYSFANPPPKK